MGLLPTPRGQDSYERRNRKTMEKIRDEGGDMTLPTFIATSLPTSRYSPGSEDSTSPSKPTGSDASDRSSTSQPALPFSNDIGPGSHDGEMSGSSPLLPTPRENVAGRTAKTYPGKVNGTSHARQTNGGHGDLVEEVGRLLSPTESVEGAGDARSTNWSVTRRACLIGEEFQTTPSSVLPPPHLTSSSAATPANPSPTPASAAAPTIRATCGPSSPVLLASFDPDSSCWRTFQATLASVLPRFSQTLPRSGMTRDGRLYALPMSALPTVESDGSALLPTATNQASKHGGTPDVNANGYGSNLWDLPHLLSSPTATDATSGGAVTRHASTAADVKALLPTPRVEGFDAGNHRGQPDSLNQTIRYLPTPDAWLGRRPENSLPDPEREASRRHPGKRGQRSTTLPDALGSLGDLTEPPSPDGSE